MTSANNETTTNPAASDPDPARALALVAARAADAKHGTDIVILDVGDVMAITGYFVLVSAENTRMVKSIVNEIEHRIAEAGGDERPLRVEGMDAREWVLLDYGDLIVHVFDRETRDFYDLERLWADVERIPVDLAVA